MVARRSAAPPQRALRSSLDFLRGGGEMGERTRSLDWSRTPVGPIEGWPHSLRTAVSICLGSRHPMVVWWGRPGYVQFYNDAYISFLGRAKHPAFLGHSARECWQEIWSIIEPMLEGVYETGEATWSEDLLFVLNRNLPREEGYFTFSYSPVRADDGHVEGIFCACNETTTRVIGERRLRTLRDLNLVAAKGKTVQGACEVAARILEENNADIPFACIYLLDADENQAKLVATSGLESGSAAAPVRIDLQDPSRWPLKRVRDAAKSQLVPDLLSRFGALPGGPWPESPDAASIVPIAASGQIRPIGFLVCGLSPRRVVDADYESFLALISGHIGTSISNARAYEEERRRAEALAALDRAKTAFFSNVSHEFRTPLTLMLGPLQEALADPASSPRQQQRLELAHRNTLRLLRLVNSLLDFARIEAGRAQAVYEPVDLAAFTTDLASNFQSACERANLSLRVDCPALSEPVYVDREMWEKIVLNLLSNAFKFTFSGSIMVRLCRDGASALLEIADTGVGIPEQELPHLFERFHRIEGTHGRSQEGTGIGLALVQELVRLHGGSIEVSSVLGAGTTLKVRLPFGTAHLDAARIKAPRQLTSSVTSAQAYVLEALRWIPDPPMDAAAEPGALADAAPLECDQRFALTFGARILIADDNADLRQYVSGLLSSCYRVEAVADGERALAAAQRAKPDLILTDIMMPRMDGVTLLKELRAAESLRDIPVIMLSARAGEESRVEGLNAGADDYLVKPFSARELLVRVGGLLELSRMRRENEDRLGALLQELRTAHRQLNLENQRKDEFLATLAHELRNPMAPIRYAAATLRPGATAATVAGARETIERQVRHMARLLDDLLDLNRITRNVITLKKHTLDLRGSVQEAIALARPDFEARQLRVSVSLPPQPLWVHADGERVAQIIGNLVSNAIKYTEPGGQITVSLLQVRTEVVIRVQDTGVGFSEAMKPKLFELFAQLHPEMTSAQGSLGIGLAVVKRLVSLHDGRVDAISAGVGQGSTFEVCLPRTDPPATTQSSAAPRGVTSFEPDLCVLVIDDNVDGAESLASLLRAHGVGTHVAHTGADALEIARAVRPGVVLLDIGLPDMSGWELAGELQSEHWAGDTQIIAISGWAQDADKQRSAQVGVGLHLMKPVDPQQLLQTIKYLSESAQRRGNRTCQ